MAVTIGRVTRPRATAAALLVVLMFAGLALRGRLPDPDSPRPADLPPDSPAATVAVLVLVGVSLLITAIAVLTTPPGPRQHGSAEPPWLRDRTEPFAVRRLLLWGLAVAAGLLLLTLLLDQVGRFAALDGPGATAPSAPPEQPAPAGPAPSGPAGAPADNPPPGPLLRSLAVAALLTAMLLVAAAVIAAARRSRPDGSVAAVEEPAGPAAAPLLAAAERGLAVIGDTARDPRQAIIACYAAMERALRSAPGAAPQDSDTPSEVLARAVGSGALRSSAAADLVEVFAEARFSAHLMTERHRAVAEQALRQVLADLRGSP